MARPLEYPCSFDPEQHAYTDVHGQVHRSITQILTDTGCTDYSMVDPVVLAMAADRGTRVHEITARWDRMRGLLPIQEFSLCATA